MSEPVLRRCKGCGERFRPSGDEEFCSQICTGTAARAWLVEGLRRFAEADAARRGAD